MTRLSIALLLLAACAPSRRPAPAPGPITVDSVVDTFPAIRDTTAEATPSIYPRGAAVLQMLRHELGDSPFWAAIGRYTKRHAYQLAHGDDALGRIEAIDQLRERTGEPVAAAPVAGAARRVTSRRRRPSAGGAPSLPRHAPPRWGGADSARGGAIDSIT